MIILFHSVVQQHSAFLAKVLSCHFWESGWPKIDCAGIAAAGRWAFRNGSAGLPSHSCIEFPAKTRVTVTIKDITILSSSTRTVKNFTRKQRIDVGTAPHISIVILITSILPNCPYLSDNLSTCILIIIPIYLLSSFLIRYISM